ncbi:MAG TPA: hypothetical protein VKG80_05845 [Trebonia sp.]|nr:hypothetical protein [Trebonia sp.]
MHLISSLERAKFLDRLAGPGQRAARLLRPGPVRDALHGVWLGHPLHPVLVQVPAATWPSVSRPAPTRPSRSPTSPNRAGMT